ncbi:MULTISPECIES: hypothetical protein [Flavobacterium]|uniref:hypothetical protein n=1 Tax=Flavobacterium TaxID=237 RepID=UPI001182BAEB|nr:MULTISPECIES: hypothetical protein [Flavobacterium]MCR4030957.1 hypothetical protein [Flavobacterium panacis]
MKLELPNWTSHHNMLIYSVLFYCEENDLNFSIIFNSKIVSGGAILHTNDKLIFFDYSDSNLFIDNPEKYDFYSKDHYR